MSFEQKAYDFRRIRLFTAMVLVAVAPVISLFLSQAEDMQQKMIALGNSSITWIALVVYSLVTVLYYVVFTDSGSRRDALIPTKRHSYMLLIMLPIAIILKIALNKIVPIPPINTQI